MSLQTCLRKHNDYAPSGVANCAWYIANQNAALLAHDQLQTLRLSHAPVKSCSGSNVRVPDYVYSFIIDFKHEAHPIN